MSGKRYSEEFKIEAVKQVTERGYKVTDVCRRLGITSASLHKWIKLYGDAGSQHQQIGTYMSHIRHREIWLPQTQKRQTSKSLICLSFLW
jgi:transposase